MKQEKKISYIDTPTPRCFPDWMRRLNPFLRREDTNPLFEALQRDLTLYHKKAHRSDTVFFLISIALNLSAFVLLFLFHQWILFYAFFVTNIVINALRRKPKRHLFHLLPKSNTTPSQFQYDIWLAGNSGSQVAETYLLQPSKRIKYFLYCLPIALSFFYYPLFHLHYYHLEKYLLPCTFLILCIQYMLLEGSIFYATNHTFNLVKKMVNLRQQYFANTRFKREAIKTGKALLHGIPYIIFYIILIFLIIIGHFLLNKCTTITYLSFCCIFIQAGIWLRRTRRKYWFKKTRLLLKEIKIFEQAYKEFYEREYM
jgi:hypothetical protein